MTDFQVRDSWQVKTFRTLSGLGDAVFAAPIVAHFAKSQPVKVATNYPDVFHFIENVNTIPMDAAPSDAVRLRYMPRPGHNYYEDYCKAAGVPMLPFELPWKEEAPKLSEIFKTYRKVCLIKEPSTAHMHRNRNDFSITPDHRVIQRWMLENRHRFYYIALEHETNTIKNRLIGIDYKPFSQHPVDSYINLISRVDHIATQIGHLAPLAQAFGKPLTLFKPEQENRSGFMKYVTPEMILVPKEYAPAPVEVI